MRLPYSRPRLLEIHDQPWCPGWLREPVRDVLSYLWVTKVWPFQPAAPYEAVVEIIERVVQHLEEDHDDDDEDEDEGDEEGQSTSIASEENGRVQGDEGGQGEDKVMNNEGVTAEDGETTATPTTAPRKRKTTVRILDCCSGAGGPWPAVEAKINSKRKEESLDPIRITLSDLHPLTSHWHALSSASSSGSLGYIPFSVDATRAPAPDVLSSSHVSATGPPSASASTPTSDAPNGTLGGAGVGVPSRGRSTETSLLLGLPNTHSMYTRSRRSPGRRARVREIRTFCLSFHHFNEDGARRILEDAMRSADGIAIFELQESDLWSVLTIMGLFFLAFLVIPFRRPSLRTLFFTYCIPLIPFTLAFDGLVSCYRTRSPRHVEHLANLAAVSVGVEMGHEKSIPDWRWSSGRVTHTRPTGRMLWVVGVKEGSMGASESLSEVERWRRG